MSLIIRNIFGLIAMFLHIVINGKPSGIHDGVNQVHPGGDIPTGIFVVVKRKSQEKIKKEAPFQL
jgi:hypothetical protein